MHINKSINNLFDIKLFLKKNILFILLLTSVSLFIIIRGPIVVGDTGAYLSFYYNRTPLIPVVFYIANFFFGHNYQYAIILIHIILLNTVLLYLYRTINSLQIKQHLIEYPLYIIILMPYIAGSVANNLASEGIVYPLTLLLYILIINSLFKKKMFYYILIICIYYIILLGRGQAIYFLPGLIIYTLYYSLKQKKIKFIYSLLLIALIFLMTGLTDRVYNYILHSEFTKSHNNWWLITPAMYLASEDDSSLFNDNEEKNFFVEANKKLKDRKLTWDSKNIEGMNIAEYYSVNSEKIYYGSLQPVLNERFQYLTEGTNYYDFNKLETVEKFANNISFKILKSNYKRLFDFYYKNIWNWFGDKLYLFFYLIFFLTSFLIFLKYRNEITLIIFLVLFFHLSDIMLLALFANYELRYLYYTNIPFFCIIIILFSKVIKKSEGKNKIIKDNAKK